MRADSGMTSGTGWIADERLAAAFSAAVLALVLSPIRQNWREHKRDGFPLSYYPMFSARRGEQVTLVYLLGLTGDGGRRLIPYSYAGTGGLNQVRRQLGRLIRCGSADLACEAVARRLAARSDGPFADVVTVKVVRGRFLLPAYFAGEKEPVSERVHATRGVERST
ncbi:MAG: hypothetical protein H0V08_03820 [Thermoleophilaceae bacterium]|nr:hypothetical protein [Thermoleophilaceae bacterium]